MSFAFRSFTALLTPKLGTSRRRIPLQIASYASTIAQTVITDHGNSSTRLADQGGKLSLLRLQVRHQLIEALVIYNTIKLVTIICYNAYVVNGNVVDQPFTAFLL